MGKILKGTKYALLEQFVETLQSNDHTYYMFAGHPEEWADDNNPPSAIETVSDSIFDTQQKMMFGKRVKPSDVSFLVARHDWSPNKVFAQYSSNDMNLFDKNFYTITDENKVYKCLYNAKGANSTVKPTLTQNTSFTTSDGYVWKYMYNVSVADMRRFASQYFHPVSANTDVVDSAVAGIDVVEVMNGGINYRTVHSGIVQAQANTTVFQIDPKGASEDDDFYTLSAFYINGGGTAADGQLRRIKRYVANSTGNWVFVDKSISDVVPSTSKYVIAPAVVIEGDGEGAQALATVSNNFSVSSVKVLSRGSDYTRATAKIVANNAVGSGAVLSVSVPPPGGHGSDPISELASEAIGIAVSFNKSEANTIPTIAPYRRYGLLRDPKAANSTFNYTANTFSQLMKVTYAPAPAEGSPMPFAKDDVVAGEVSGSQGIVVHCNSSILIMIGDKSFSNAEIITVVSNSERANTAAITSIVARGDIDQDSTQILYINNTTPVERANTESETVKLVIQL